MTTTTKKLDRMPYAQACVKCTAETATVILVSYNTIVAELRDGWLTIFGLYSMTTRRHIGAFMAEYCHSTYQFAKQLFEENIRYNIFTGEIEEI